MSRSFNSCIRAAKKLSSSFNFSPYKSIVIPTLHGELKKLTSLSQKWLIVQNISTYGNIKNSLRSIPLPKDYPFEFMHFCCMQFLFTSDLR
jgi:hypothetical protein